MAGHATTEIHCLKHQHIFPEGVSKTARPTTRRCRFGNLETENVRKARASCRRAAQQRGRPEANHRLGCYSCNSEVGRRTARRDCSCQPVWRKKLFGVRRLVVAKRAKSLLILIVPSQCVARNQVRPVCRCLEVARALHGQSENGRPPPSRKGEEGGGWPTFANSWGSASLRTFRGWW